MRLIDADKIVEIAEHAYGEWNKAMGAAEGRQINRCFKMQELCKAVKGVADDCLTIDPESLRPTAHIMRGTVPDTHDDAFCSKCVSAERMTQEELRQLHRLAIEHRPEACLGCGLEHDCFVYGHGCAVIRKALRLLGGGADACL